MIIGNKSFDTKNNTYIMGILNVTPDSFSDGGMYYSIDAALRHTEEMIRDGAHIIDVGGESTRPGFTEISAEEEKNRVVPVIEKIKNNFDIPISVDTYRSDVAQHAVNAGADLVNDIWGLRADEKMAGVIANNNVACCIMHNKKKIEYDEFLPDMIRELSESCKYAESAGIDRDKIIIDPGIGFAKTQSMNLCAVKHLDKLTNLGYPVLLGCSRKSVIDSVLHLEKNDRVEGTIVTTVYAVLSGCAFVRVHDIKENVRAVKMAMAIKGAECK